MQSYSFLPCDKLPPLSELPNPFSRPDGSLVQTPEEWEEQRAYLKAMLAHYLYGEMPSDPGPVTGSILSSTELTNALSEKIVLKFGPEQALSLEFELIRPADNEPHPVLIWNDFGEKDTCPITEELLQHGIILVRFCKEQLGTDSYAFYEQSPCLKAYPGYRWRAIAVWAWGYSRIIDYLETQPFVDTKKIAATGYSRNGKVALCAAIYDERITLCAPGGSGCGGSGSFRYLGGRLGEGDGTQETIGSMSQMFAYWWADELRSFGSAYNRPPLEESALSAVLTAKTMEEAMKALLTHIDISLNGKLGRENHLPFDMHFARTLIAPRPLLTTDSLDDEWANPYGIQLIWRASSEVYRFLGAENNNAMFFREGGHQFSYLDWIAIADFLYQHFCRERAPQPRVLPVTLQLPKTEAERQNTMFPQWFRKTPHFSWRAPKD